MMSLPPGFDYAQLFADFYAVALPFVSIAFLIGTGFLVIKLLRRV